MAECPTPLVSDDTKFDCGELSGKIELIKWHEPSRVYLLSFMLLIHIMLYLIMSTLSCIYVYTGCGSLIIVNGLVNYTNSFAVGSVATHICNSGYRLLPEGGEIRTCSRDGWDGQDVTCTRGKCDYYRKPNNMLNSI